MKKPTLQERYVRALEARGWMVAASRSTRHVTLTRAAGENMYVGRAGSLRRGPNFTSSAPVSDKFKKELLR